MSRDFGQNDYRVIEWSFSHALSALCRAFLTTAPSTTTETTTTRRETP